MADLSTPAGKRQVALKALLTAKVEDKNRLFDEFVEAEKLEREALGADRAEAI